MTPDQATTKSVFSIDVEDWFHILDTPGSPPLAEWDALPSRLEKSLLALLDILSERRVRATCFFLGWVGTRYPDLVIEAKRQGHEIGPYGYAHPLAYQMTARQFLEDARKSKAVLEDLIGAPVIGYRAHGGPSIREYGPHPILTPSGSVFEFPVTVVDLLGIPFCIFGGGYLRITPYFIIRRMARRVLAEGRPVVYYIHPRDLDPSQPRLPMGPLRRFKSYVNLDGTHRKIARITEDAEFTTFAEYPAGSGGQP